MVSEKRWLMPVRVTGVFVFLFSAAVLFGAGGINPEAMELYKSAQAAFKGGQIPQAIESLEKALGKEPDNAVYRYGLGFALMKNGQNLSAKENFEIVSRSRPSKEKGDEYNAKLKEFKSKGRRCKKILPRPAMQNLASSKRMQMILTNPRSPSRCIRRFG